MEYPQEHIKPYGNDGKKSEQVEEMFDNIAPAYDKLNHTLSMGIDRSWRKKAIDTLRPFSPRRIMDVATGTGDFAILACRELQPDMLIGTDISEGMMNVGREKVKQAHLSDRISFAREDCTSLSFVDESFDAVTVAFGMLDKAKLEKRIASLEGERKSFNKGKRDSEFKLESKTGELRNNTAFIDAMTEDWNRFLSVVQTDKEGNRLNIIKVDGVDSADEKVIGKRLQEIAKNATTGGLYTQVGELYGFPIKVVSERILKEGLEFTDNRFVVEGNYKYTYNNGHLAMADPLAAARNFLNAMERIPSIIDQYKAKNEVLEMEIPQLQEIAGKVWKKEDELKQLKSELAALDRKIQLELAPPTPEVAEKENEGQQLKPEAEDVRNRQAQYPENAPPQIRSPADSIVANHVIIGRPGLYAKEETRSKGLKI